MRLLGRYKVYRAWVEPGSGAALAVSTMVAANNLVKRCLLLAAGPRTLKDQAAGLASRMIIAALQSMTYGVDPIRDLTRMKVYGAVLVCVGGKCYADPGPGGYIRVGRREVDKPSKFELKRGSITVSYGDTAAAADYGRRAGLEKGVKTFHVDTFLGRRKNNEDAGLVSSVRISYNSSLTNVIVGVVADGAGGLKAGERASNSAVASFYSSILSSYLEGARLNECVYRAVLDANSAVILSMEEVGRQIATTLTGGLIDGEDLALAHVGDSRAYIVDHVRGLARRITEDHKASPGSHVITRALGLEREVKADIISARLPPSHTLLLCTDGVTDVIRDAEIGVLARSNFNPKNLARAILSLVKSRGAPDNATLALVSNGLPFK